jgi:hypothetical protein
LRAEIVFKGLAARVAAELARSVNELKRFLGEGKYLLGWLAFMAAVLLVFWSMPAELQSRLRWAGTLFEFLGVLTVVMGINHTRVSFGRPSMLEWPRLWLSSARYIFIKRPPISANVNITVPSMTVAITAEAPRMGSNSIEERVAWLEKESETIRVDLNKARSEFATRSDNLRRELDAERAERERDSQAVNRRLEQGMVGDSHIEIAGVAFLVLGLLFANLAQDLADWLPLIGIH